MDDIERIAELTDSLKQISFPATGIDLPTGSVAVIVNYYAGHFGGSLSQLLKCLTAVKVCAEFEKYAAYAVPVCLVCRDAAPEVSTSEISRDALQKIDGSLEEIFPNGDSEALTALKEAFAPDTDFVSSCARWLKGLLKDFGVIVAEYDAATSGNPVYCVAPHSNALIYSTGFAKVADALVPNQNSDGSEPRCFRQSRMLPTAAFVMDYAEIPEYVNSLPFWERGGFVRPLFLPSPTVSITNAGSLKTLKRYGLGFEKLFEGKERVMDYVRETLKSDVPVSLQKLKDETRAVLEELETAVFAANGERSDRIRKARAARIVYQLEKILKHSRAALADKEETAKNRISKACDFLAPLGKRQQDVLRGAYILVYYGLTGLRELYERLDITATHHQLIEIN